MCLALCFKKMEKFSLIVFINIEFIKKRCVYRMMRYIYYSAFNQMGKFLEALNRYYSYESVSVRLSNCVRMTLKVTIGWSVQPPRLSRCQNFCRKLF